MNASDQQSIRRMLRDTSPGKVSELIRFLTERDAARDACANKIARDLRQLLAVAAAPKIVLVDFPKRKAA